MLNRRWQIFLRIKLPQIRLSLMSALMSLGPGWSLLSALGVVWQTAKDGYSFLPASTFINALRRFFAIRGPAKQIRSDCGTNFKGACRELGMLAEEPSIRSYISEEGCRWVFNPPHASHMGGAWERLIGLARRILDSMLLQNSHTHLTHDMLATFLAEVSAIMNARPLAPISSDPNSPALLTPATLLTQKVGVLSPPPGDFEKDLCRQRWKQVQHLANSFWERWLLSLRSSQAVMERSEQSKSRSPRMGTVELI